MGVGRRAYIDGSGKEDLHEWGGGPTLMGVGRRTYIDGGGEEGLH